MARYDKVDPKSGSYRSTLAADYDPANIEKIIGVGHDASGRVVKGAGVSGITGVLVLTKAYKAGYRCDVMTHGEITEFGPTAGVPGTDFGDPGKVYYSDASGNIVGKSNESQVVTVTTGSSPVTLSWNGAGPVSVASGANGSTLTQAQVQSALESLSNIDPGDVSVSGSAGGPFTVIFKGRYAGTNVPSITATNATISATDGAVVAGGLVRVGHTAETGQRLIVRVEPS